MNFENLVSPLDKFWYRKGKQEVKCFFISVYKYKKETDASIGDKLSKLSLHSIKKKSSRIKERFSVNLGFIDQMRDEIFDKEETRYRSLEKIVRVFVKDVQTYMDQVIVSAM